MRVVGTLSESDDDAKSKVKKGTVFPPDAAIADLFTLIENGKETTFVKKSNGWYKLLLDGDTLDAGEY